MKQRIHVSSRRPSTAQDHPVEYAEEVPIMTMEVENKRRISQARMSDQTTADQRLISLGMETALSQASQPDSQHSQSTYDCPVRQYSLEEATTRLLHGQPICLQSDALVSSLQEAPHKPPIEQNELADLDLKPLMDNIQIRHDLNYDRTINFEIISNEHMAKSDQEYCIAVAFELALYFSVATSGETCRCSGPSRLHMLQSKAHRLPRFFHSIRMMMKDLIRQEHWVIVDQAIDVDLLMNQLRRGSCDLLALMNWLGGILKQSCSPVRDCDVDVATTTLEAAMRELDGDKLTLGISKLFNVFTSMKLDVAHHQMRIMLPPLINDSVDFVRQHYEKEIKNNRAASRDVWCWYQEERMLYEAKAAREIAEADEEDDPNATYQDEDYLTRWAEIVLNMITSEDQTILADDSLSIQRRVFELDIKRIRNIQQEISTLEEERISIRAGEIIWNQCFTPSTALGIAGEPLTNMLSRLSAIRNHDIPDSEESLTEALSLEIVRTAYALTSQPADRLPERIHLTQVQSMLTPSSAARIAIRTPIRAALIAQIEEMVFEEINGDDSVDDLLPSQILDKYKPYHHPPTSLLENSHGSSANLAALFRSTSDSTSSESATDKRVREIAQSIAHVALIQWRIWALALFFKDWSEIFDSRMEYNDWLRDVGRRAGVQFW